MMLNIDHSTVRCTCIITNWGSLYVWMGIIRVKIQGTISPPPSWASPFEAACDRIDGRMYVNLHAHVFDVYMCICV
jgi:hypothetical protein